MKIRPPVMQLFTCYTQWNMISIMLLNVKMSTIDVILTFVSMVTTISESLNSRTVLFFSILVSMSS